MKAIRCLALLSTMLAVSALSLPAMADLAVPGDFQDEIGAGADWSLADAPLMNDLGGGLWDISLSGLAADTRYQFKIVNAEPAPIAWGNGEVPDNGPGSPNSWLQSDAAGEATINLDRNSYADGFLPAADRIVISTDSSFTNFFATGDWMDEAGGAGDWNPSDPAFELQDQGSGLYSLDVTVSTPGVYQYKATGGSFDHQWGTNGRLTDAGNWQFETFSPGQSVTFLLDISKGAISLETVPEPATLCLLGFSGIGALASRRRR